MVVDRDRALEHAAGIVPVEPRVRDPIVVGGGDRRAHVRVRMDIAEGAGKQDRIGDSIFVDELLAQERGIGSGGSASGRNAIEPRAMNRVAKESPPTPAEPIAPWHRQILADLVHMHRARVDIAIHESGAGFALDGRVLRCRGHALLLLERVVPFAPGPIIHQRKNARNKATQRELHVVTIPCFTELREVMGRSTTREYPGCRTYAAVASMRRMDRTCGGCKSRSYIWQA